MSERNIPDSELIDSVRGGDTGAFRQLFKTHYASLCTFAYAILKRKDLAEDAVSCVFEEIWHKRAVLHISGNVRGYLFAAVRNRAINIMRTDGVFKSIPCTGNEDLNNSLTDNTTANTKLRFKELEEEVERLLSEMPEQRQTVFRLNRFENLRYKDIAQAMNLSERTVQNHMVLAMKQLEPNLPRLREMMQ